MRIPCSEWRRRSGKWHRQWGTWSGQWHRLSWRHVSDVAAPFSELEQSTSAGIEWKKFALKMRQSSERGENSQERCRQTEPMNCNRIYKIMSPDSFSFRYQQSLIFFVLLADVLIWEGAIFNYLSSTTIVGRMGTWTVAAAACARHNLVRASRLPLLFALQMGHIFKNPEQIGSGLIFNPIIIYWRPPRIIILLSAPVRKK